MCAKVWPFIVYFKPAHLWAQRKNDPDKICIPQNPLKEPKYEFEHEVDNWTSIFICIREKTIIDNEYD